MFGRPRLRPDPGQHRSRRLSFSGRDGWELFVSNLAVQASIGQIRQNVDALNVEIGYDRVILHACFLDQDAETTLDLECIRGELEATLDLHATPRPEVLLETTVGINGPEWDGWWHTSIYKAHWSTRESERPEPAPDAPHLPTVSRIAHSQMSASHWRRHDASSPKTVGA